MSDIPVLNNTGSEPHPFHVGSCTDLRWADADRTIIACMVTFPHHHLGLTEPMPFHAHAGDSEAHGQALFHRCASGEFGPVGAYVPPSEDVLDSQAQTIVANALLQTQAAIDQHRDELDAGETTLTAEQFAALQTFRAALRNVKKQPGYPRVIDWPVLATV